MGFRLDLHVHSAHSKDARGSVADLVRAAKRRGLQGFALTDHDTLAGHAALKEAARASGLLLVPAVEITSAEGHLLALGIEEAVPRGLGVQETAELVEDQNGVLVASHPLRLWSGIGPSTLAQRAEQGVLHAAEARNARERRLVQDNTERLCRELGLAMTGGSDAHWVRDIGTTWTEFEEPLATVGDVLDAIRGGSCRAAGRPTARGKVLAHQTRLAWGTLRRRFG